MHHRQNTLENAFTVNRSMTYNVRCVLTDFYIKISLTQPQLNPICKLYVVVF
jgi:hypothetical protein